MKRQHLTAVDLCSGAGGVTTGYKQAGITVIAAVDIDERSRSTYSTNHPDVKLCSDDLLKLDPKRFARDLNLKRGQLDILTACVPCQTFSTLSAKNRKSHDPRNRLVNRVIDFVEVLKPRCVVMENVPGLRKRPCFRRMLRRLKRLNYGVWFDVINAADFGVPQSRKRLVLIAMNGLESASQSYRRARRSCVTELRVIRCDKCSGVWWDTGAIDCIDSGAMHHCSENESELFLLKAADMR